jgi:hypothetical protein
LNNKIPLRHSRKGISFGAGVLSAATAAATVVVAAATAAVDEDDGEDDQPNPVIFKQIAQTVVHKKPPRMK